VPHPFHRVNQDAGNKRQGAKQQPEFGEQRWHRPIFGRLAQHQTQARQAQRRTEQAGGKAL
jgi:hypothetical protein